MRVAIGVGDYHELHSPLFRMERIDSPKRWTGRGAHWHEIYGHCRNKLNVRNTKRIDAVLRLLEEEGEIELFDFNGLSNCYWRLL